MHGKIDRRARSFAVAGVPLHRIRSHIADNVAALQSAIRQSQETIEEARAALRNADRVLSGTRAVDPPLGTSAPGVRIANEST